MPPRPVRIHHSTSEPYRFFGREPELALIEQAFEGGLPSVVALVGPGGQGKTAIVQHWLSGWRIADGVFLWSFYRGKDADLCLRELYAYAEGRDGLADVSATWCVDHLVPLLRQERWALVLDGTEVVQYDSGPWFGRIVHPELARLIEELAAEPMPGVVVLTTRFPLPGLNNRRHARVISLSPIDRASARGLLTSLGVVGSEAELDEAATSAGCHAKAVELLGTYLVRFHFGQAVRCRELPVLPPVEGASDEEEKVARVLAAYQASLSREAQDILAMATAFREPPSEPRLLEYLASQPVEHLLHSTWQRTYQPFSQRPLDWLLQQVDELVRLRLLERVGSLVTSAEGAGCVSCVIDAHPLVRRAFEHVLGTAGRRQSAQARAGFLRGRPDRRRPADLEQAREEVEMFHAFCDACLWNEADGAYVALDNPKHRFLAPAFERDLLLRFFPGGDWRQPPLWPGFGRYRSLAICFELLGNMEDALAAYRVIDAPLRGDALLALGRLGPLVEQPQVRPPWQTLWQAYRAHALCLAGRTEEAVHLARSLVPVDVYEWVHVFECLLRAGELETIDLRSMLYRPPQSTEHRWAELARQRMRADYLRVTGGSTPAELEASYLSLLEQYDRGGMPLERCLARQGYVAWQLERGRTGAARAVNAVILDLASRHRLRIIEADGLELAACIAEREGNLTQADAARSQALQVRAAVGYHGRGRP